MAKPSLNNGDVWSQPLANASIRPYVAADPSIDEPGSMPPLVDSQLSGLPGNIKSNFYGWYRRIELSLVGGLLVAYSGASVLLPSGELIELAPGQIAVPNNTERYIYVAESGSITLGTSLPNVCIPLAKVTAVGGEIAELIDLRYQEIEQVKPISLPPETSPLSVGDLKTTARINLEPGWLECDGRSLSTALYPDLFAAIGYAYGGSGNAFNIPDLRGRVSVGAGQGAGLTSRARGQQGGSERVALSGSEMPSHSHGVSDPGHSHGFNDPGHSHAVNDPSHSHAISDPGHEHSLTYKRSITSSQFIDEPGAELSRAEGNRPIPNTGRSGTGIAVQGAFTGVSLQANRTGGGITPAGTGIGIQAQGGGAAHENMQPFTVIRWVIKAS